MSNHTTGTSPEHAKLDEYLTANPAALRQEDPR